MIIIGETRCGYIGTLLLSLYNHSVNLKLVKLKSLNKTKPEKIEDTKLKFHIIWQI